MIVLEKPYSKRKVVTRSTLETFHKYRGGIIVSPKYKDITRHQNWENPKIKKKKAIVALKISEHFTLFIKGKFSSLINKIKNSIYILNYEDDWDEEGAIKYSDLTFYNSCKFVVDYFDWIWREYHIIPETPNIFPGPDGSIDLLWKSDNYDLLLNFPPYPCTIATFYGDDKKEGKISGQFEFSHPQFGIFIFLHSKK